MLITISKMRSIKNMQEVKTKCKTKPQVHVPKKNEKRNRVKQANMTTRLCFPGTKETFNTLQGWNSVGDFGSLNWNLACVQSNQIEAMT